MSVHYVLLRHRVGQSRAQTLRLPPTLILAVLVVALTVVGFTTGIGGSATLASAAPPRDTNLRDFALGAPSSQSSTTHNAVSSRATDGNANGGFDARSVTATELEDRPWWQVDLGSSHDVDLVRIWNRTDDCCIDRLGDFWVFLSAVPFTSNDPSVLAADKSITAVHVTQAPTRSVDVPVTALARYVRVQLTGTNVLSLAEVQVLGPAWTSNFATDAVVSQSSSRYGGAATQAIDGNTDGDFGRQSVTHTRREAFPWWQADLGHRRLISEVRVWNRTDCCSERLSDFWVQISDVPFTSNDPTLVAAQAGVKQASVKSVHVTAPPSPQTSVPINVMGRYVRIQLSGTESLSLAEVEINGPQLRNYVPGGAATQSTAAYGSMAENAQDGNTDGDYSRHGVTHTANQMNPWWQVDLGEARTLTRVKIWNRTDCCTERLRDFWVFLSATPLTSNDPKVTASQPGVAAYHFTNGAMSTASPAVIVDVADMPVQYLRVQIPGRGILSLAEVEAFGTETLAPVDAAAWNATHQFGMFLHYGMGTATDTQWAEPGTPASTFNPPGTVDTAQWASAMKSAGMTWGALTVKHHDGFALWPTAYSNYSIAASPYQNGKGDIVRNYVNALRAEHLDVGIYFSIWDRTNGETPALVKNQLRELLTHYGPISYIFCDGWEIDLTGGSNRISYNEVRDFIRNISPNTVVANNDHTNMIANSDFIVTEYGHNPPPWPPNDGAPREIATMMDKQFTWFWTWKSEIPEDEGGGPRSASDLVAMRNAAYVVGAHFLLNVGPRLDGTFEPKSATVLQKIGESP